MNTMNTGRATYNMHDDRLKVWFDERLSKEDYNKAKQIGFVWFYGQKCFSCVWRPGAEDFIASHGIDIECIAEADDVAARAERFDRYANNAEDRAANAAERLETGRANTERRARLAEGVAAREFSKAEYWQGRIAAAIAHADFKEDPGLIYRRIDGLETDLRRHTKNQNQRWIDHIGHRIEYEQARLAATGHTLAKLASNEITLGVGGALELNRRRVNVPGWYQITKVNPKTIEVYTPKNDAWRGTYIQIPRDEIAGIASKAQVEAGECPGIETTTKSAPTLRGRKVETTRDGAKPEKLSSFKRFDGTLYIITKVNRISVDYVTRSTYLKGTEEKESFYCGKCSILSLIGLKSPAETKRDHPEALEWPARLAAMKERIEAKQAQQSAQAVA
jgi:hypothetical protein